MNARKLILGGAVMAVGILAFGSIGFAVAQTSDTPNGQGAHGTMAGHGQMGDHADMAGHGSMGEMDDMPGHATGQQAAMHEAAAKALGITVTELDSQLASGKTIADIAAAKGIDLATLQAAMQAAHPEGHGTGMGVSGMNGCP